MHSNRNKTTHTNSVQTPTLKRLAWLGILFLAPSFTFASVNQLPIPASLQQTTIRSFHETTKLAETLWADLTTRFVDHYEKGDYQNALSDAQRAYAIANNNFGLNDVNTADTLLKLGIINQTLGNLNEAEDYLLGSLVILEDQLSPDHSDVAVVMTNLGNVYFELQRPEESEKYHLQALQIRKNAFGENDPTVAQSVYNLAVLYENEQKYEQAADLYRQAINTWSQTLGPTHPYVGNALNNLANIYSIQGKHKKAAKVLKRTVAFKKSVFGAQHEEVAQTLISLGTNYVELGEYIPASSAYEEALDIARHVLPSSDPQLALLMYTLANIYHTQARIEERKDDGQMPFNIDAMPVKDSAKATGNSVALKATDQHQKFLFKQALPLYQKAAEILDGDTKSEARSALDVVLSELAMLYKEIGDADMAQATESRIATH